MMVVFFTIALIISVGVFKYAFLPLVWIVLVWSCAFVVAAARARSDLSRAGWINATAIILAIGAFEVWLWLGEDDKAQKIFKKYSDNAYMTANNLLCYATAKGQITTVAKYVDHNLIYHVTYSINDEGLRVVPQALLPDTGSILFFGCSFTYGEG